MENSRLDTSKKGELSCKRKMSPSPEGKNARLKLDSKDFFNRKLGKALPEVKKMSPNSPATSDVSDIDISSYLNYQDTFNLSKKSFVKKDPLKIDKPAIDIIKEFPKNFSQRNDDYIKDNNTDTKENNRKNGTENEDESGPTVDKPQLDNVKEEKIDEVIEKPIKNKGLLEKHVPETVKEFMSNKRHCIKVYNWLHSWPEPGKPKALLISGPPGVGKTRSVRVVCKPSFTLIELNASDCRNKQIIKEKIRPFLSNSSMIGTKKIGKSVLLMDEVDGMSAGDDGGISAIIECIKVTRIPIICICNDRYSNNIRSLVKYCTELKFPKPTQNDLMNIAKKIVGAENLNISENYLKNIVECADGDVRAVFNMIDLSRNAKKGKTFLKDDFISLNSFEISGLLFNPIESISISLQNKVSLVIKDYEFIPALIEENYIDLCDEFSLTQAADALALGDVMMNRMRKDQEWSLLPDFATLNLIPTSYSCIENPRISFPSQQLSYASKLKKNLRLLLEFKHDIHRATGGCNNIDAIEYRKLIYDKLLSDEEIRTKQRFANLYTIEKNTVKNRILEFFSKDSKEAKRLEKKVAWLVGNSSSDKPENDSAGEQNEDNIL